MAKRFYVRTMDNLTGYATFNEDTFEGPTNVEIDREYFNSFEEAESYYMSQKAMYRGSNRYVTFPNEEDLD